MTIELSIIKNMILLIHWPSMKEPCKSFSYLQMMQLTEVHLQ